MALYKESHNIKVFEPNEITLNAVQGEGNEREYEFALIEKSGETLKTSNAQVTNKMLDVTGCSVRLFVAKPDGHIVYMDGRVSDGKGGIISFIPKQQVFAASGKADCILQITSANGDLRAIGVSLNIGPADIDGALESTDEFTAFSQTLVDFQKAIANGTSGTEVPLARDNEVLLGYRLDKIENGTRIHQGTITLDKMASDAKNAFAAKNHTHANYAEATQAGAQQFLSRGVMIYSDSLVGAVNAAAIQKNAVTETKLSSDVLEKYGHLPYTHISSDTIDFDNYIANGIYHFEGRYSPVTLFVLVGNNSNITQIRIQGDKIQARAYKTDAWTDWSGDKTELAESLNQLDAQVAQLQIDTQAHGAKLDTLDRQYAGTAVISTTTSYKMDASQVVPGSKVLLTLINGPTTSCFVRSDYYPLYYYGTHQVVQPEYNKPVSVSAEDLIAGIKLSYGGAFTVEYQTGPSKVFLDRIAELEDRVAQIERSIGGGETS